MLTSSEFLPSEREFFDFLKIRFATVGIDFDDIEQYLLASLEISEKRFLLNKSKYFTSSNGKKAQFTATNYSSHALLLYELSRECFLRGRKDLAEKVYFLNIATTTTDLFYEVDLPLKTGCEHPLASVMGRAKFSSTSSLYFYQQCTLGSNLNSIGKEIYPSIDGSLFLYSKASLIGDVKVSGLVILARATYIKDAGPLSDCIVFGESPNLIIKPLSLEIKVNHTVFIS
jgi:serine O-acetyltransferase